MPPLRADLEAARFDAVRIAGGRLMAGAIRYCAATDGVRIAYSVQGDGPTLVECNGFWNSFVTENLWSRDAWAPIRAGRSLIRFDARGIGLSERDPPEISHRTMISDLECVTAAAGADKFALWGGGVSVPSAIEFAVRHPERVQLLVLSRGVVRAADIMPRANLVSLLQLIETDWALASRLFADMDTREAVPDYGVPVAAEMQRNINGPTARRWLEGLYDSTDVTSLLPLVQTPTLVLHRTEDSVFPFAGAQEMAACIPNARLFAPPGESHLYLGDDVQQSVDAIVGFLNEGGHTPSSTPQARRPAASFVTVLFTDVVGHAETMSRLGDARGRDVLREHDRITREALAAHSGVEIKTMGDGFMASFASVTSAVECAVALQRAHSSVPASTTEGRRSVEGVSIRVGLNAGEPIEEDGDLFGATVILASRICAMADAGEILVPDAVRGLLSGKGFLFRDRGAFVPKGFDESVRVWEVEWRE